jgi:hypothetical protein
MKKLIFIILAIFTLNVNSQEKSSFSVGADFYSSYIWRGTKLGDGPAFQPSMKFDTGGLTIGVWGSFDASGYAETDPYILYTLKNGLSIGLTNYYYPSLGGSFFSDSSNVYEVNAGYTKKRLSFSVNYILNKASLPGSYGNDMFYKVGYAFTNFNISAGAGNGWHTSDTDFDICHIGIGTEKIIKISDSFSIPVNGQVILNPDKNILYLVVGFSL